MTQLQESLNATFSRFIQAVSEADCNALREVATQDVRIDVPGASFVDITENTGGSEALCKWAETVRRKCGRMTFIFHRYFENGCELITSGHIQIERLPRLFDSPCAFHVRVEAGRIAAFQLLLDTYALQKFRGEFD